MAYSTDILTEEITIQNRKEAEQGRFGLDSAGIAWATSCKDLADVSSAKGKQALNAGAIDAYAVVLVRMRYNPNINMRSRIIHDGQKYAIIPETFHANYHKNEIQFNAQLIINDYEPEEDPTPTQETGTGTETGAGTETGGNENSQD